MSTNTAARPDTQAPFTDTVESHTARYTTRWLQPSMAIIAAHGEIDASNGHEFIDYALRHSAHLDKLVLDLSGVEFFGTAGFSALHNLNVQCAGETIHWAMVPSSAVTRLLRVCDPDSTLPLCDSVDLAAAAVQGEPRRLLQLVSEPR